MTQISLDTSILISLLDSQDIWHKPAIALEEALKVNQSDVAIFDCVLAEVISTLVRRIYEKRRVADLDQLITHIVTNYPTDDVLWVLPDVPILYNEIIELVRSSRGELNFNDALIALSCRNRNIPFIVSFDRDFDQITWVQRVAHPDDLPELDNGEKV